PDRVAGGSHRHRPLPAGHRPRAVEPRPVRRPSPPRCQDGRLRGMVNWSGLSKRARRIARWGGIGTAVAHGAAMAAVLTVDRMRNRRYPPGGEVPRTAPRSLAVAGSEVTVYTFGQHVYDAMLESIRAARHTIYFETFIWKSDEIVQAFTEELIAAAERVVQVY